MSIAPPIRRAGGNGNGKPVVAPSVVRCAVYARQSVSEGNGESASISVQREACEAFIAAHRAEGWVALSDTYVDQGISGATLQRPGMQRLLADVAADRVDAIITYKLDRVSRNLADFAALVAMLDRRGIRLVSVTQSFDTKSAIGRLTLGILMSFSEFERSLVSERTRDAVVAARKKGRWTGGITPLGYALVAGKLVPEPIEAQRVKETFALYLQTESLIDTAEEMNRRGWTTKVTATRDGGTRGGVPWSKSSVHRVLSSPVYIARTVVDGEAYEAEHPAIVGLAVWQATQKRLQANGGEHTRAARYESGALLRGLAFCGCGAALTPTFVSRPVGHAKKRFSYYACSRRIKQGKAACSAPYVPAARLEAQVVAEIARHAQEPAVVAAVAEAARQQLSEKRRALAAEKRAIEKALRAAAEERATTPAPRLPALTARVAAHEVRRGEIEGELAALAGMDVDPAHVAATVADFPSLWGALLPRERRKVVEKMVARAVIDVLRGAPLVRFPTGEISAFLPGRGGKRTRIHLL
jgi:site-specific DNA recombinase